MARIVSIDIGTSRIKVALFDETGNMNSLLSRRLDRAASPDTQDAVQWFDVTASLLRKLNSACPETADAVVLTGNMHALLGVDRDGSPVAPAQLWSDNSAQEESDQLNALFHDALLERFGNASIPVFTLPKIMRMKKETPERYAGTVKFLQSKDYIAYRLTGNFVTDPSDASGTLAMELDSKQWSVSLLDELMLDAGKLPDILPSDGLCGRVTAEAASLTGLAQGTPVITGAGDLASAAIGGGVNASTLSLTLGTAGQLLGTGLPGCGRKLAGRLFVFAHADPAYELYLDSVPSGGFSFEWFAKLHNISVDEFFRLAQNAPFTEELPIFLPYILGRGAPYMDYAPNGAWLNLKASHTLADLCRAAVFGALCPLRQCADLLEDLAGKRPNLVLQALACRESAVKASAGALFRQKKLIPANSEASLLGGAVIAMTALGVYPDMESAGRAMVKSSETELEHDERAELMFRRFLKQEVIQ